MSPHASVQQALHPWPLPPHPLPGWCPPALPAGPPSCSAWQPCHHPPLGCPGLWPAAAAAPLLHAPLHQPWPSSTPPPPAHAAAAHQQHCCVRLQAVESNARLPAALWLACLLGPPSHSCGPLPAASGPPPPPAAHAAARPLHLVAAAPAAVAAQTLPEQTAAHGVRDACLQSLLYSCLGVPSAAQLLTRPACPTQPPAAHFLLCWHPAAHAACAPLPGRCWQQGQTMSAGPGAR
mmetsp:Transcript_5526/g.14906  ORF Transcript_5526/g.14906 Transcript_5526/m.14906 type:complete len:235 (+) Transcript_5526:715-1419(+)